MIEAVDLEKHFPVDSGLTARLFSDDVVHAVDGVNLSVESGETLGLVGESGCGKSTLGRTLLRLYEPTGGRIRFRDEDITDRSQKELRSLRRDMQMVFQDPQSSLNPRQTVGEILRTPIEFHGLAKGEDAEERVIELLREVGLQPEHINRYPHEFSGGQQQRIGLARALSVDPEFIVLDEPVSALDVSVQAQILSLIDRLKDEYDLTLVFISHDLNVIRHVCDRVAVMYLGEVVECAETDRLFDDPMHPYTRALLNSITLPDTDKTVDREQAIVGDVPSPIDPPSGCRFRTRCPEEMDVCAQQNPETCSRLAETGTSRELSCHLYDPDESAVGD